MLFAKDFSDHTKESMLSELKTLQGASTTPLALAVDEEGGTVTRVSRYPNFRSERFLSPQEAYAKGGYDLLESLEKEKAQLLLSIGLNVNFAPVADVSINPEDFIYTRSFGQNAIVTAEYVQKMVQYANESGISSCLKHFPGYGNNVDTHTGISVDERSYENFLQNDFLPFQSGIDANVPMVMVSHNIVQSIDPEFPSSLSKKVVSELRNTLHFTGIVITDDLAMGAIDTYASESSAAVLAMTAGNDMMIVSDLPKLYQEILTAVENDEVSMNTIDVAVRRILAWKMSYGIIPTE